MAHKTFISYKYSEAQDLRDDIIKALGDDAQYYKGETSDSPDLKDTSTSNIKKNLCDMMFDTSVTIVIISPHMKESKWIDWEIEYCLKNITRKERTSHTNGVVGVIMKFNGGYDWFTNHFINCHGAFVINYRNDYLYPIIYKNHFNSDPPQWHCPSCKTYDWLNGSYIEYINEDDFLSNPQKYINNAYDKSENDASGYSITPTR
ncbi:TIR domain-containing protein [Prevotella herbatica]|uniref:TIR domain-containing protein n=1 Tax=Prevotella herbatica TaxID=2801997 RepID=A0ABN6EGK2_9BACT|nr:TIR domain-containing protein [Prevotella herbatica]BCS85028.1 TIR domain-containing protein [Prevotella herbatica]